MDEFLDQINKAYNEYMEFMKHIENESAKRESQIAKREIYIREDAKRQIRKLDDVINLYKEQVEASFKTVSTYEMMLKNQMVLERAKQEIILNSTFSLHLT